MENISDLEPENLKLTERSAQRVEIIVQELERLAANYYPAALNGQTGELDLSSLRDWKDNLEKTQERLQIQYDLLEWSLVVDRLFGRDSEEQSRARQRFHDTWWRVVREPVEDHRANILGSSRALQSETNLSRTYFYDEINNQETIEENFQASYDESLTHLLGATFGKTSVIGSYAGFLDRDALLILLASFYYGVSQSSVADMVRLTQPTVSRSIARHFPTLIEMMVLCRIRGPLTELGLRLVTNKGLYGNGRKIDADLFLEDDKDRPIYALKFKFMAHDYPYISEERIGDGRYVILSSLEDKIRGVNAPWVLDDDDVILPLDDPEINFQHLDIGEWSRGPLWNHFLENFLHPQSLEIQRGNVSYPMVSFRWLALWPGGEISIHPSLDDIYDIDDEGTSGYGFLEGLPEFIKSFDHISLKDALGYWW